MCEKCRAGQMLEYERKLNAPGREIIIRGKRCERCGFTLMDSDDDIWATVGL